MASFSKIPGAPANAPGGADHDFNAPQLATGKLAILVKTSLHRLKDAAAASGATEADIALWIKDGLVQAYAIECPQGTSETWVNIVEIYLRLAAGASAHGEPVRPQNVPIKDIKQLPECQVRCTLRPGVVGAFSHHYAPDKPGLHPVVLIKVDEALWLVDGFHRVAAAQKACRETIRAVVLTGTPRTAIEASRRLNNYHGRRLATQDVHRLLVTVLAEQPGIRQALVKGAIPYQQIADAFGISKSAVGAYALELRSKIRAKAIQTASTSGKTATANEGSLLTENEEMQRLLHFLHEQLAKLPGDVAAIRTSHKEDLTLVAGATLRLLGIHLHQRGYARSYDLRRVLDRHPLFSAYATRRRNG